MSIVRSSSGLLVGNSCSFPFNYGDVPFPESMLQLLTVLFTSFEMTGLTGSLRMESYILR